MNARVGLGFDVHPFAEGRPLVLGGVVVPGSPGLAGHSDADVVTHAVADALASAAGLPDLGTLFPATDAGNAGASSVGFLREVAARLRDAGFRVVNVSVVVAAEAPRLAPHLEAMRARLADALVPVGAGDHEYVPVAITPKRTEGVGAVGRGEGIAAWAVALVERAESPGSG